MKQVVFVTLLLAVAAFYAVEAANCPGYTLCLLGSERPGDRCRCSNGDRGICVLGVNLFGLGRPAPSRDCLTAVICLC
ncbi:hypothetical protein AAVH_16667 [Aphelenchoides avenae]|nr:hypothetical protein AAVH_16667 [Aphelenchus avenae]